ncbi:hypothetical protein HPB50_022279 [Hyalomma asiaticum]|uniref:Uncharacterized protein n=1 Tax=Hyalomma asiaticum TaxID=266040 RepID=A0ACB7TLV3_HYAAI|nr:hypothetical protein HPB50_022279 [Hyalomma asiaticum]
MGHAGRQTDADRRTLGEGYEMCNLKRYKDAIELFTQAIKLYAQDHRALKDAEKAISLKPEQAKGYFRRAKAQFGLEKYNEAAESFRKVLEIDPTCLEAQDDLYRAQFFEIVSMGFTMELAEWSLAHGNGNVWTAVNLLCGPDSAVPDVKKNPCNMDGAHSQQLWVGNLKPGVTLMMLSDLFERYSLYFPFLVHNCLIILQLGKDKVGYTICHGIVPYFRNMLLSSLINVPYLVVCFDEALNKVTQKQQMDVLIRYWDAADNSVKTRYLTSCFLGHTCAEDLASAFRKAVQEIKGSKILQVCMDGLNVNFKFLRSLNEELR